MESMNSSSLTLSFSCSCLGFLLRLVVSMSPAAAMFSETREYVEVKLGCAEYLSKRLELILGVLFVSVSRMMRTDLKSRRQSLR